MSPRTLHVNLSPQALANIEATSRERNRSGLTLREWLVRAFESVMSTRFDQPTLFTEAIVVDDDVPLLLETLARVAERDPNHLVEAWALEEPSSEQVPAETAMHPRPVTLPDEVLGKVAELLDIEETLFEETVSDARRRLGGYPEGKEAEKSATEVFRALRRLLGFSNE